MLSVTEELILDNLYINGKKIWSGYRKLSMFNNNIGNNNFNKIKENIFDLLQIEKKLYSSLGTDNSKIKEYKEYIFRKYYIKRVAKVTDLFSDDYTGLSSLRMMNKLLNLEYEDYDMLSFDKDQYFLRIAECFDRDLQYLTLSFLKECCENTKNKDLISYYHLKKYEIAMINMNIENEIINSDFELNSEWLLCSPLIANVFRLPTDLFRNAISKLSYGYLLEQIYNINEFEFNTEKDIRNGILFQSLSRAYLTLLNFKDVTRAKIDIYNIVNGQPVGENRKINDALINEILTRNKNDMKRVKYLTLERNK